MKIIRKTTLDQIAARICKHNGKCLKCKSQDSLEWCHIVSRRYTRTRWDLDNCMCLCHGCHFYFTNNPLRFEEFVISKIGEKKLGELKRRANDNSGQKIFYNNVHAKLLAYSESISYVSNYSHAVEFLGIERTQL